MRPPADSIQIAWATTDGTSVIDVGLDVATDPNGRAHVTGVLGGNAFGQGDTAFVARFTDAGARDRLATFGPYHPP